MEPTFSLYRSAGITRATWQTSKEALQTAGLLLLFPRALCHCAGQDGHKACAVIRALGRKEAIRVTDLQSTQSILSNQPFSRSGIQGLNWLLARISSPTGRGKLGRLGSWPVSIFLMGSLPLIS